MSEPVRTNVSGRKSWFPETVEIGLFRIALAVILIVVLVGSAPPGVVHPLTSAGHPVDDFSSPTSGVRLAVRVDDRSASGWTVMPPPGADPFLEPDAGTCTEHLAELLGQGAVFTGTLHLLVEIWATEEDVLVAVPEFALADQIVRQPYEAEVVRCVPHERHFTEADTSRLWAHTTVNAGEGVRLGAFRAAREDTQTFVPFEVPGGHVHTWRLTLTGAELWVTGVPEIDLAVDGLVERVAVDPHGGPISLNPGFEDHQWHGRTERVWCETAEKDQLVSAPSPEQCPAAAWW